MSLTFNQFQKLLIDRGIDGPIALVLTIMYEQVSENSKQMDQLANMLLATVESVQRFTDLHQATQEKVARFINEREDGVEVASVPFTDDDEIKH